MAQRTDLARGRDIVARWCDLAERRLQHLTELFESGRWRRYHSEQSFLENITEAKAAVETWRNLLTREAALDNSAVDLSWLGRARSTLPPDDRWRERLPQQKPQLAPMAATPVRAVAVKVDEVMVAAEAILGSPAKAPVKSDLPVADFVPPTLDFKAMQQRYPLLRNAL